MPIYNLAEKIDGCNFSTQTIWEGEIKEGNTYQYLATKVGYQYISEAADLTRVPKAKYDFLLSSHCLEHVANPLKAI